MNDSSIRKKKLFLNTSSSIISQVATIICGFVLPRLILNHFGSEVNGLVNSITQFLSIIAFLELGIGSVLQFSLYKPLAEKNEEEISKVLVSGQKFFTKIALILLVYVLFLMGVYPLIANQNFGFVYTATMIGAISISSFAQYFFGISNMLLLQADQKGYVPYNVQTFALILNTIVGSVLIELGASIHLVKLSTSLIFVLKPLILALYVKKHYHINWKIKYEGEPLKQKWNGMAQQISDVALENTDNVVLTVFAGLKEVSIYSVYYLVISGIKYLLLSITIGMQSLMGELWAKQELEVLRRFFGWVEWVMHTAATFLFGATSVLILPFVIVYTNGVTDVDYVQPLFALLIVAANAVYCFRLPYHLMVLAGGHYKQTQYSCIIAMIMNIVISVLAVRFWGLVGVAIGTLIAMLYQTIWLAAYNSRNFIEWPFKNFIKQMAVDFTTVVVLHVLVNLPRFRSFFTMYEATYAAWILLAVKVSVLAGGIVLVMNLCFYRGYVARLVKGITSRIRK